MEPQQQQYAIELRGGKPPLWVTENQAKLADRAWSAKGRFKLGGSIINSADIAGIWTRDAWYEMHPQHRPAPNPKPLPALPTPRDSDYRRLWLEVLRRNAQALRQGKKVGWTVRNGEIVWDDNLARNAKKVLHNH